MPIPIPIAIGTGIGIGTTLHYSTCTEEEVGKTTTLYDSYYVCDGIVVESTELLLPPAAPTVSDTTVTQGTSPFPPSIPVIPGATTYTWTVPSGADILSGNGSPSILVDWNDMITGAQVCVTASNACGSSEEACFYVFVDIVNAVAESSSDRGYVFFPNPTGDILYVVFEDGRSFEVSLLGVLGREVLAEAVYSGEARLDVRGLAAGVYWLGVRVAGEVLLLKSLITLLNK